jgi:hypothetical protein
MAASPIHSHFPSPALATRRERGGDDIVSRGRSWGPCDQWVEGAALRLPGAHGHEWVSFPPARQRHPEVFRAYDG